MSNFTEKQNEVNELLDVFDDKTATIVLKMLRTNGPLTLDQIIDAFLGISSQNEFLAKAVAARGFTFKLLIASEMCAALRRLITNNLVSPQPSYCSAVSKARFSLASNDYEQP